METNKKMRSEKFWSDHIRLWTTSGQSKRKYCIENGLSYWTFREWQKRQSRGTKTGKNLVQLPREIITGNTEVRSGIEIQLSGSIIIRINHGFDGGLLRDVLRELGIRP